MAKRKSTLNTKDSIAGCFYFCITAVITACWFTGLTVSWIGCSSARFVSILSWSWSCYLKTVLFRCTMSSISESAAPINNFPCSTLLSTLSMVQGFVYEKSSDKRCGLVLIVSKGGYPQIFSSFLASHMESASSWHEYVWPDSHSITITGIKIASLCQTAWAIIWLEPWTTPCTLHHGAQFVQHLKTWTGAWEWGWYQRGA